MRLGFNAVLFTVLITMGTLAAQAQGRGMTLTGDLMYPDNRPCDRCPVKLESMGIPVQQVFTDSFGRFVFEDVQSGGYIVRVNLEGFNEIEESFSVDHYAYTPLSMLRLTRKPVLQIVEEPVVDLSDFLGTYPKKAVDLYKKALQSNEKGKVQQAAEQLEKALEIAPNFYQAHNDLGILYRQLGRLDEAEREFLLATELNQSSADPLIQLSSLYIDRNEPARAVEAGEEAIKKNSRSPKALLTLGLALYRVSRLDRAEDVLKKALDLAPNLAQVRLMLANVYMKLRDWDSLQVQLDSYLEENPEGSERAAVEAMRDQVIHAMTQSQ